MLPIREDNYLCIIRQHRYKMRTGGTKGTDKKRVTDGHQSLFSINQNLLFTTNHHIIYADIPSSTSMPETKRRYGDTHHFSSEILKWSRYVPFPSIRYAGRGPGPQLPFPMPRWTASRFSTVS